MEVIFGDLVEIVQFVSRAVIWTLPFFVISIGLAVLIQELKLDGMIAHAFNNRIGVAIVAATAVGAFSPFCSCTVVPVVAGLLGSGVPLAPVMSFWVASPLMDPEIFALSAGILGWELATVRLVATLILSLASGYGTWLFMQTDWLSKIQIMPKSEEEIAAASCDCSTDEVPVAAAQVGSLPLSMLASPPPSNASSCCGAEPAGVTVPSVANVMPIASITPAAVAESSCCGAESEPVAAVAAESSCCGAEPEPVAAVAESSCCGAEPEPVNATVSLSSIPLQMGSTVPLTMVEPVAESSCCGPTLADAAAMPLTLAQPLDLTLADEGGCCAAPEIDFSQKPTESWVGQVGQSFKEIRWDRFGNQMLKESWRLGRWLLLAFLLEALITLYVPQTAIAATLGGDGFFAVPFAALLGVPLYLSNLTALPIIQGLLEKGMQSGAAIAFLIAGPVTTMPAMTAVWGVVHRRIFYIYLLFGVGGAIVLGFATNLIYASVQ